MIPKFNKTTPLQKGLISGLVRFHDLTYTNRVKSVEKIEKGEYNQGVLNLNKRKDKINVGKGV